MRIFLNLIVRVVLVGGWQGAGCMIGNSGEMGVEMAWGVGMG